MAQPRPHSHPPPVKAPEPAKPAALVDLLSLDTPAPAPAQAPAPVSSAGLLNSLAQPMPAASQPAETGLESEVNGLNSVVFFPARLLGLLNTSVSCGHLNMGMLCFSDSLAITGRNLACLLCFVHYVG